MSYKVVNDFHEKYHGNHLYKKGHKYPKKGYKIDPERVAYLLTDQNQYKLTFLEEVKKGNNKSNKTGDK
nr:hypothetical protein [Heyndrickxia oleronia]